jgi:ribose-phosphate pyrophosphokinase
LLADYIRDLNLPNPVVVSPDAGGVGRALRFRERIGAGIAIIAKQRPEPDKAEVLEMVGEVENTTAIIVDDMISTGGTLAEAANTLRERGARAVYACATHGIFAADAFDIIGQSSLVETIITNTIPLPPGTGEARVRSISVAPLFAEAIMRIHKDLSLSALFS